MINYSKMTWTNFLFYFHFVFIYFYYYINSLRFMSLRYVLLVPVSSNHLSSSASFSVVVIYLFFFLLSFALLCFTLFCFARFIRSFFLSILFLVSVGVFFCVLLAFCTRLFSLCIGVQFSMLTRSYTHTHGMTLFYTPNGVWVRTFFPFFFFVPALVLIW